MRELNIEIRIPFCRGNCVHCDSARCGQNIAYLHKYRRALEKEMESASDELSEYDIRSVHIKGDCVQLLGSGAMDDMLRKMRAQLPGAEKAEWVIDMMPDELDEINIFTLRSRNRIGRLLLRLFADSKEELKAIHGPCTQNITSHTLARLAENKVDGLEIELVLGTPGQTEESLGEVLRAAIACEPVQVSFVRFHDNNLTPAQQREYAEELPWSDYIRLAGRILAAAGYERAGKSLYFARPGMLREECRPEAAGRDLLGFGIGAFTEMEGLSYRNTTDYTLYTEHSDNPEMIAVF